MLDITEMMNESLDALTNNSSVPTTPTTPMTPMTPTTPTTPTTPITPMTPMTPMTPVIPIHYNPSKTSISSPTYNNIPPSPLHEMEIIRPNDNRSRRHFKIIGDSSTDNDRSGRHLSRISSSSTASSSDFSIVTTNTLNSTMSASPSPTLHDADNYLDDLDFEKLINFDHNNITDDFSYNNNNNANFDVIINVGEEPYIKRFRSNSVVLSKRSSYFRTAFSKCWAKKHGDVYLFDKPNMSPKVFTAILRYLHFGNIKLERLDISTILDLLIASDELSLEDFTCEIQTYFIHLNSDWLKTKIVSILQCCYSNQEAFSKLLLHTLTIIKRDPTCLLIQNHLHLLSERILDNILKECCNGLEDWAIWQCILKWALGQDKINEFSHDVRKWHQNEFNLLHELMFKLVEKYVRFSHISRNYFLDKVLPYLNYWVSDVLSSKVREDANEGTVIYYLSHYHRHYTMHHHITHNNTYTNHHTSSSSSSSSNIILEDSALINHVHALKITDWIQEGHFISNIVDNTTNTSKSKKFNPYRFSFPFFRKRNRQQENSNFISTALTISTNILTVTATKSSTKVQINQQQQQQQQQPSNITSTSTPAAYQFNLLFRMSRDGASAYYDRCMNQGPTLVITKIKLPSSSSSNNRYILVGGYNPIGFNYFSKSIYESNSSTLVFTFGDGKSFEKSDVIRMMISDDNCKEINKDCTKITKDCSKNFKSTPTTTTTTTTTTLSMKKPKKESIFTKFNNPSSISINNNLNRFDNNITNGLCFGNNLIINFHEKFVEFNSGQNFGLIKSDIVECEIFQVKELCY